MRGKTLINMSGFSSISSCTSSASLGCRGNELDVLLQAFAAQLTKLRLSTFISITDFLLQYNDGVGGVQIFGDYGSILLTAFLPSDILLRW